MRSSLRKWLPHFTRQYNLPRIDRQYILHNHIYRSFSDFNKHAPQIILLLSACFLSAGAIFLFIDTWEHFTFIHKMGMALLGLLISASFTFAKKLPFNIKYASSLVSFFLMGICLLVPYLTFYTHLPIYYVYAGWLTSGAVWFIINKNTFLYVALVVLLNLTLFTYFDQTEILSTQLAILTLLVINILLLYWLKGNHWFKSTIWSERLIFIWLAFLLIANITPLVLNPASIRDEWPGVMALLLGCIQWYIAQAQKNKFELAIMGVGGLWLVDVLIFDWLDSTLILIPLALVTIIIGYYLVRYLQQR